MNFLPENKYTFKRYDINFNWNSTESLIFSGYCVCELDQSQQIEFSIKHPDYNLYSYDQMQFVLLDNWKHYHLKEIIKFSETLKKNLMFVSPL